jgi:hypothetical protein
MDVAALLRLVERTNRETVLILQALHSQALRGEVADLAICFREGAQDQWVLTGLYKTSHAHAVNAAVTLKWRLYEQQEGS